MATIAAITGIELPENAAPDSYNILPVLKGEDYESPLREATVHNTYENKWGIREGPWFYINNSSGEHTRMPQYFKELRGYKDFKTKGLLFNLEDDPEQRINLYEEYPEKVSELDSMLHDYRSKGYSVRR